MILFNFNMKISRKLLTQLLTFSATFNPMIKFFNFKNLVQVKSLTFFKTFNPLLTQLLTQWNPLKISFFFKKVKRLKHFGTFYFKKENGFIYINAYMEKTFGKTFNFLTLV